MPTTITRHEALEAAQKASGKVTALRRVNRPDLEQAEAELADAKVIYAVVALLEKAPPITPEGKARVLALIEAAPLR